MTDIDAANPPAQEALVSLSEIIQTLAARVQPYGEPMRLTVDKVRKRVLYAIRIGDLHVAPGTDHLFSPQVMQWSKLKWPAAMTDVRAVKAGQCQEVLGALDELVGDVVPATLEGRKQALIEAFDLNFRLARELRLANEEIARLAPLAERYENIRRKNRLAAGRPRKGL